jgi:hypothetical protein
MPDLNAWMIHGSPAPFDIISASMARPRRFYGVSLPVPAALRIRPGVAAPGHAGLPSGFTIDHASLSAAEPGTTERFCLPLRFAGGDGA